MIPFAPYGSAIIAWTQKTLHPLARLPNIAGSIRYIVAPKSSYWALTGYTANEVGYFSSEELPTDVLFLPNGTTTSETTPRETLFDASRSSPIYGASTTVQPPALKVAVLIKHD